MDDFLYNLRKSVEDRSKSGNRHADGNTVRGGDRRCGMDRRNRRPQKHHNDRRGYPHYNRNLHEIRVLLEKMLAGQAQQRDIDEKRLALESRRTAAMERIAEILAGGAGLKTEIEADSAVASETDAVAEPDAPTSAGELMKTLRAEGKSYDKIAKALEAAGFSTVSGRGRWRGQTVKRELAKLGVKG
ncbi:MAG: hypothetical protein QNJ22_24215 [Desulfosarcinaceae bacterium]|nr:hypothetical protein [Desulfosarcinaceae bacterium]